MSGKLENAKSLYLDGIRDGNVREAVTRYTGDRYTQHSTGVADGVEGFVEFFLPFIERNPVREIEIVRSVVDGQYVFLQAYQNINDGEAQWVTTDLFDTDENDKIVEHWDVIAPFVKHTVSGHTQIDGPTEIADLGETERNKAIVREFLDTVLVGGKAERVTDFISTETYIQHNPQVDDGLEGFGAFAAELAKQDKTMCYLDVFKLIGQGNFVVSYCKMSLGDEEYAVFDIFRLENGLIVEHWDNMEVIPPQDQWNNSGKF